MTLVFRHNLSILFLVNKDVLELAPALYIAHAHTLNGEAEALNGLVRKAFKDVVFIITIGFLITISIIAF